MSSCLIGHGVGFIHASKLFISHLNVIYIDKWHSCYKFNIYIYNICTYISPHTQTSKHIKSLHALTHAYMHIFTYLLQYNTFIYTYTHIKYVYMYTYTYIGFMHAYYVHIANIHTCMGHTQTRK